MELELTEDEIKAEDEWFLMHWKATGTAIRFALAQARDSGPSRLGERVRHADNAKSGGWCQATESDAGGGVLVRCDALPLTSMSLEAPVGPEEHRLEHIMRLGLALGQAEQQHFAEAIAPSKALPWTLGGQLPFDTLDSDASYDVLLNEDSVCGRAVAPHTDWLGQRLNGQVVSGNFGPDFPLLVIPAGSLKVHMAGDETYKRTTAGLLRIGVVGAIECVSDNAIVAIAANPTPQN